MSRHPPLSKPLCHLCHFSITEKEGSSTLTFDARKWRSGLGAYFFCDCTAEPEEDGRYVVGSEAIS